MCDVCRGQKGAVVVIHTGHPTLWDEHERGAHMTDEDSKASPKIFTDLKHI